MAFVLKDRVRETTTTTGTGTLTLGGAVQGFQSFAIIGDANTTYYVIFDTTTGEWEVGIGEYTATGTTLSRDTVLSSSSGGTTKVSLAAGTKEVFVAFPAERAVTVDTLPTTLDIEDRDSATVSISLTDGYIPVTNRAGGQSRIYPPFVSLVNEYLPVLTRNTSIVEVSLS
jgi:hypothetical protein